MKFIKPKGKFEIEKEVVNAVKSLRDCFNINKNLLENSDKWYCGVTGQKKTNDEFELKRIKDHYGDDFPDLDPESICKTKVSSVDIAMEVERIMKDDYGFDIGKRQNEPTDKHQIWVYIFREIEK